MLFEEKNDATSTLMGDFTMNGLIMFVIVVLLLLPFVNDPKQKVAQNIDPPHQGVLRVELFWPDEIDTNVDLWVKAPIGDAVGYSNLGGELFNLLRDDLGTTTDASGRNMEIAYTRGIWDGEYIVNAHLFSLKKGKLPVPVKAIVSFKESEQSPSQELFFTNQVLKVSAQELTLFRFQISGGKVVTSSLHSLQKNIRAIKMAGGP